MKAYEIDLKKLKRYAIKDRLNKVSVRQFAPQIGRASCRERV